MKYLCDGYDEQVENTPPPLELSEKIGEIFEFVLFFFSWVYFTYEYDTLPNSVPISFDIEGNTQEYGQKTFLFAFPGIHTCIYVILTILGRFPQTIKYPVLETPQNQQTLYLYGRKLILYFKIMSSFLFIYLTFGMIGVVKQEYEPQDLYNCFAFIFLYIPGIFYFFRKCRSLEAKYDDQRKITMNLHMDPEIILDGAQTNKIVE